jgi:hypothetical protein
MMGNLIMEFMAYINEREWEVLAVDCDLPVRTPDIMKNRNNTILRALDNNQVIFIRSEYLVLKHRCNACPNCGKDI